MTTYEYRTLGFRQALPLQGVLTGRISIIYRIPTRITIGSVSGSEVGVSCRESTALWFIPPRPVIDQACGGISCLPGVPERRGGGSEGGGAVGVVSPVPGFISGAVGGELGVVRGGVGEVGGCGRGQVDLFDWL